MNSVVHVSDAEHLFMCLLAICMPSIKILNHHVVPLKYYIINQIYFNKRAICKKNPLHTNKQFLCVFETFGMSHFSSVMALPVCRPCAVGMVSVIWLCPVYNHHVCGSAAQYLWWACRGASRHGSGGPTGLLCVCLHPSAHNSLLQVTAATSPWSPTSHTSSSSAPFLLELHAEGDSGKPGSTWPELTQQNEAYHCTLLRFFWQPYWQLLFWNKVTQK